MEDFFTWQMLTTHAGATLATTAITQVLKGVRGISKIPTRLFSYLISLLVLIVATLFVSGFAPRSFSLCFLNAILVSLASNGAYDGLANMKSKGKATQEEADGE